jgi:hypothetical protein
MRALRIAGLFCFLFFSALVNAQPQQTPGLQVPDPSNPAIATFIAWHQALLKNDFVAYKKLNFSLPQTPEKIVKENFDGQRANAPSTVKIAEYKVEANGSISFLAVGCKDNRRLMMMVGVAKQNGAWTLAASGWGPPWNDTYKLCPV